MGAGRKTETYTLKEKSERSSSVNGSIGARNLRKSQLGGVIFGCKHSTYKECMSKLLFGLPAGHFSYVQNIGPGLPLFLFNYSDRKLHGIFEAACEGRMNINPHGWTEDGSKCTAFPAQVRVRVRLQCHPLVEDQFRPVIADNYSQSTHFWFELDQSQTNKLISMFSSAPVPASRPLSKGKAKLGTLVNDTSLSNSRQKECGTERTLDEYFADHKKYEKHGGSPSQRKCSKNEVDYVEEQEDKTTYPILHSGPSYASVVRPSYSSVVSNVDHSVVSIKQDLIEESFWDTHSFNEENRSLDKSYEEEIDQSMQISKAPSSFLPAMSEWCTSTEKVEVEEVEKQDSELNLPTLEDLNNSAWNSSCDSPGSNGKVSVLFDVPKEMDGKVNSRKDVIDVVSQFYEQFNHLKQQMEDFLLSVATGDPCLRQNAPCESLFAACATWGSGQLGKEALDGNTSWSDAENGCLHEEHLLSDVGSCNVKEILLEVNKLKSKQSKQDKKISSLEEELVETRREIKNLKQQLKIRERSLRQ